MANFDEAIDPVLKIEEGNSKRNPYGWINDFTDNGGETLAGITQKNFPHCPVWVIVEEAKKGTNFPKNLVDYPELSIHIKDFYKGEFWNKADLDNCPNQEFANKVLDEAVNFGLSAAEKMLNA